MYMMNTHEYNTCIYIYMYRYMYMYMYMYMCMYMCMYMYMYMCELYSIQPCVEQFQYVRLTAATGSRVGTDWPCG